MSTMTDNLTGFLAARVDEDEADAPNQPDPDRALREVAAKRAIIADHSPSEDLPNWCKTCDDGLYPCRTARQTAAVYSDHPDYRAEWKS